MFRGGGVSIRPGVVIRMAGRVLLAPPVGVTVYEAGAAVTRGRCDAFTGRKWSMPNAVTACGPVTAYGPVTAPEPVTAVVLLRPLILLRLLFL